ncbi:hypothetical protein GBAR_LOCUS31455 [Geodia barretti]|uniref:Uncharacterized protein n=1 Tax=Geodia barretti TaxID=519541 RepID=A0AA35XHK8_GEOBA|nr:hypothetical protein GBAR_LOCUS31455 [Geodia barretti]
MFNKKERCFVEAAETGNMMVSRESSLVTPMLIRKIRTEQLPFLMLH